MQDEWDDSDDDDDHGGHMMPVFWAPENSYKPIS
jgi:hypothetical protein